MGCVVIEPKAGGYLLVRMDSGAEKNALTHQLVTDLLHVFDDLLRLKPKVVVLCGREDVFCAGGDKDALRKLAKGEMVTDDLVVADRVLQLPFPVIAAMEGHAMGGGLAMGACCDLVLAAEESRFGAVFMNMGFTPGMGSTTLLPLLFGPYLAAEMMYGGRRFKGKELKQCGTHFNYIGPRSSVLATAEAMASRIAEKPRESLYLLKHSLSGPKKQLMQAARMQEDLMHRISFAFPETQRLIEELY